MKTVSNQLAQLSTVFWSLKQVIRAAPREVMVLFIQLISQGIIPALSLVIMKNLVNWVSSSEASSSFPFALICIWSIILLTETLAEPILALNRLRLNEKVLAHCNLLLMEQANRFEGLELFENKTSYNDVQFLKEESKRRPLNFVYIISGFLRSSIATFGILFMLVSLNWWIPVFVFFSTIPHAISTVWFEKQSWDLALFRSPESRKMAWLSSLTLDERSAKEIRLFGFGDFLINYYKNLAYSFHKTMRIKRTKESFRLISLSALTVMGHLCSFIWLIHHAKVEHLTGGAVVMGLQAFIFAQREIGYFMQNLGMLTPTLLFFEKFKKFLAAHICPSKSQKNNSITWKQALFLKMFHFNIRMGDSLYQTLTFKSLLEKKLLLSEKMVQARQL